MRIARKYGISGVVVAAVMIVIAVIAVAAYDVSTVSPSTTTSTSTLVTTSRLVTTETTTTTSTSVVLAPLISYSADAYATEATALLAGFSATTGTPVAPVVSGGANADASSIAAGAPDDVFISVSLSATAPSHLGSLSSNWAIGIASDQMVLAYSNATLTDSAASAIVKDGQAAASSNATSAWNTFYTSLTSGSVKVGVSSPVADPAGLRAWLVLEAAGYLYSGGNQQTYASSLLGSGSNVTASSAANLVAPLQSGQIQFLFIYKSAAITDGLGYLSLDTHVNLSDPSLASFYSQFSYTDAAGRTTGAPIVIVVTVPLSSVNTAEALEFVQYVVKNMSSLSSYGLVVPHTALLYSSVTAPQTLPQPIQLMLSQGLLVQAGPI
ncbi:MAG: substrate-binding domain-containing protein [Nitrososphaerota archaeon]|nr:substrate-binding domain-containing protein [Nitrososphaerota archaeon]